MAKKVGWVSVSQPHTETSWALTRHKIRSMLKMAIMCTEDKI